MSSSKSKYTHEDRKHVVELIENLDDDDMYTQIFDILIKNSKDLCTKNNNGIFLNLSMVDDKTLDKVYNHLNKISKKKTQQIELDIDIIPSSTNEINERTYKLSNYEKNIIRQRNLKKVLNSDNEYQEMKINPKKTNNTKTASSKQSKSASPKQTKMVSTKKSRKSENIDY
jgi:hypothetical protein